MSSLFWYTMETYIACIKWIHYSHILYSYIILVQQNVSANEYNVFIHCTRILHFTLIHCICTVYSHIVLVHRYTVNVYSLRHLPSNNILIMMKRNLQILLRLVNTYWAWPFIPQFVIYSRPIEFTAVASRCCKSSFHRPFLFFFPFHTANYKQIWYLEFSTPRPALLSTFIRAWIRKFWFPTRVE